MKTFICLIVCLCCFSDTIAQHFFNNDNKNLNFIDLKKQFNDFKQSHNLKKEKKWKYYKRWENEMQLHTMGNGLPANGNILLNEVLKKQTKSFDRNNSNSGWYPVGPNAIPNNLTGYMENGIGRINCMAFDPNDPSTFYIGVAQGGVWKTTNNGNSYTPLTDNLPITRVSDICIDPLNTNTIYISLCDFEYIGFGLKLNGRKRNTHYGLGVYKSVDGGLNWMPTGLSFTQTQQDQSLIRKILVNKQNSNKIIAGGVNGLHISNDGGVTFTNVMDSLIWDLVQDPTDINTVYAASGWVKNSNDGYAAIYKSTDFGNTWTILNTNIPGRDEVQRVKIAIAPSNHNIIYAVTVNINNGLYGIYKSTDAGTSWNLIFTTPNILDFDLGGSSSGQGNYDLALCVDKNNSDKIYVGGINIWTSEDGGLSFNPASHWTLNYGPTLHCDIHYIDQHPTTGYIYVCSDGGIYRSQQIISTTINDLQNGSIFQTQWQKISDGIQCTSFYRISSSKTTSSILVAGAQDNATFIYNGTEWSTIFGGDGMDNYIDPLNSNNIIGSSQYGNFYLSNDMGTNYYEIYPNTQSGEGEWTTPIVADYNNSGTLYCGFNDVSKSTDNGNTWQSISAFPIHPNSFQNNEISAIASASNNNTFILVAKRVRYEYNCPGSVYFTTDDGNNWTNITENLPDSLYYTGVEINIEQNELYACLAGFENGLKVFKRNIQSNLWTNISYNLPNIPINCIKKIPNSNIIIAATDIGVYTHYIGSTSWQLCSTNLPNVIISDIEINEANNTIYASTFGRGIWAIDLNSITNIYNGKISNVEFNLYPSPNNGTFKINCKNFETLKGDLTFEVINTNGSCVYKKQSDIKTTIDFDLKLSPGMYFIKISGVNIYSTKSFIVK